METRVWGSRGGQGATWMHWSDMMELKLMNGCSGLRGGVGRRGVDIITG